MQTPQNSSHRPPSAFAATPVSVQLLRDLLLLFPVVNLAIVLMSLVLGGSISSLHTVLSIAVTGTLTSRWQNEKNLRSVLVGGLLFALSCSVAVRLAIFMVDMQYDSRSYHGPAVIALADGWNPLRQLHVCAWSPEHCPPTHVLIDHYPKGQWYLSAGIYRLVGNIDAGKSMNVLLVILAFIVSYEFVFQVFKGRRSAALLTAAVIAGNPVALAQMFCGYVDGLLASSFTVYSILLADSMFFRDRGKLVRAALILPYLVNLKFTGLVFSVAFTAGIVLLFVLTRRAFPRSLVMISAFSLLVSVGLFGFNPYITNVLEKGNPFFPAYQPRTGQNVLDDQAEIGFLKRNRFEKFVIAQFSVPQPHDATYRPVFAVPLTRWDVAPTVALRFGGFGPAFSAVLIVALLQLLVAGDTKLRILGLLVLATVFSTDAGWWARLAPQTWLAICLLELAITARPTRGLGRYLAWAVVGLMLCNAALVGARVTHRQAHRSVKFAAHVDLVRSESRAVLIVDNYLGLFEFYNRRKVVDCLGAGVQMVERCDALRKNQIFQACREVGMPLYLEDEDAPGPSPDQPSRSR
jgi:hypothetical protein